jgi:hypothetical protein
VYGWTDLVCDVQRFEVDRGANSAAGRYESSSARIIAADVAGRLAPWATLAGQRINRPNLPIRLGLRFDDADPEILFTGWVDAWSDQDTPDDAAATVTITASDGFKYLARADKAEQAAQGAGELAGTRLGRILNNAGWTSERHLATGSTPLTATTLARPALEEMWLTVDTDAGALFVDRHGAIVFWDRAALAASANDVDWTFVGPHVPVDGICPGELTTLGDDIDVANVIGISREDGTAVWREDPASIGLHGRRSWSRFDLIHQDETWSATLADLQLADRAALEFYVSGVVLYPLATTEAWPVVVGAELGDVAWVLRRRGGQLLDTRARVVGIRHVATPDAYQLVLGLGPPIRQSLATWDETVDADTGWDLSRWSAA